MDPLSLPPVEGGSIKSQMLRLLNELDQCTIAPLGRSHCFFWLQACAHTIPNLHCRHRHPPLGSQCIVFFSRPLSTAALPLLPSFQAHIVQTLSHNSRHRRIASAYSDHTIVNLSPPSSNFYSNVRDIRRRGRITNTSQSPALVRPLSHRQTRHTRIYFNSGCTAASLSALRP